MPLRDEHKRRYARHIMMDEIGESGQEALARTSVLIIGAGGLGAASIAYLAASGIGHIGIVDDDHVELSNLQRQIIHEHGDIGRLKVDSAADRISELNPDIRVETHALRMNDSNASELIAGYNIIADGCDNFATRFAVNRACIAEQKPLVSAAVSRFSGQLASFMPYANANNPCYQCLVPEPPPEANNCTETGVISPLCGIIGSMQALDVLKIALDMPALTNHLLRYDGKTHQQQLVDLARDPSCPACASTCQKTRIHA